jgi:hypothetical protein
MSMTNVRANENLATWQQVWRRGIVPGLSTKGLQALKTALEDDDRCLIQGQTTEPEPLQRNLNEPVEAACAVSFAGWQGERLETVDEVEDYFARVCAEADQRLGEPAAVRYFFAWFDQADRPVMLRELLAEVNLELQSRGVKANPSAA